MSAGQLDFHGSDVFLEQINCATVPLIPASGKDPTRTKAVSALKTEVTVRDEREDLN